MQCEGPQIETYTVLFTLNVTISITDHEGGSRKGIQDLGKCTSSRLCARSETWATCVLHW